MWLCSTSGWIRVGRRVLAWDLALPLRQWEARRQDRGEDHRQVQGDRRQARGDPPALQLDLQVELAGSWLRSGREHPCKEHRQNNNLPRPEAEREA